MRSLPVLLLLLASCIAAPRYRVATTSGLVRAPDPERAQETAELLIELDAALRRLLPSVREVETEVWVQDELRRSILDRKPDEVKGFTAIRSSGESCRIHLRADAEHPRWFLAHELVHALRGEEFSALPHVLEEGLCEVIAERVDGASASYLRTVRLAEAAALLMDYRIAFDEEEEREREPSGLQVLFWREVQREVVVDLDDLFALDTPTLQRRWQRPPASIYGIGYFFVTRIVERHGFEGLLELCRQARADGHRLVPIERIYAAAGLAEDELGRAILQALDDLPEVMRVEPVAARASDV